ncbi:MAG: hypothetical protein JWM64_1802 [Frankiales bacterium]|nr:hypothetical protein [Frankiales bacterium]
MSARGTGGPALPDSGDGRPPPSPDALPHPALWSDARPGQRPFAYDGAAEDDAEVPPRTRGRLAVTWAAVLTMIAAAVVVGFGVALPSLVLVAVGVVLGLAGAITALKARVLDAVSVGQSPTGPG